MRSRSRSRSRSPMASTRRPPPSIGSSVFEYEEDAQPAAGPSGSDGPRTPTNATFGGGPGSTIDGASQSWLSTPMTRPTLRRHISAGAPGPSSGAGFDQSNAGNGNGFLSRSRVSPQCDYLANWETLADLMVESPQDGPSHPRRRDVSSPAAAMRSSATSSQSTLRQTPVTSMPDLVDAAASDPSMSGILSSSPPTMDSVMDSLASAVTDTQESPAQAPLRSHITIRYGATEQHARVPSGPPQTPSTPKQRKSSPSS